MLIDVYDNGSEIIILPHNDTDTGRDGYFSKESGRDRGEYYLKTVEFPIRIERGNLRFEAEVTPEQIWKTSKPGDDGSTRSRSF